MSAQEIVVKARELIACNGLAKGTYQDANGCLCILGACRKAYFGDAKIRLRQSVDTVFWKALGKIKEAVNATGDTCIAQYNDSHSKEEVLRILDEASGL